MKTRALIALAVVTIILAGCPSPVGNDQSNNADLASLSLEEADIAPAFSAANTSYSASVGNEVASVTVSASAADGAATIVSGTGGHDVVVGDNDVRVVVEAEDGTRKTYTITVSRAAAALSDNADLATLSLSGVAISPAFEADVGDYTATVENGTESITVEATTADDNASILSGTGSHDLDVGDNTIDVVVQAEDGATEKTYTVVVTREAPGPSSNADLASLSLSEAEISPAFDPSVMAYTASVDYTVDEVTVEASAAHSEASITSGTGAHSVGVGDTEIIVEVEAEDGTLKTYTITVTRAAPSTDATLASLSLEEAEISPEFDPATTDYTASVLYAVDEVTISATVSDPTATIVSGTGAHSLDAHGEHPLDVVVEAEDGTLKTYTITVMRAAPSTDATLASLSLEEAGISPEFDPATTDYTASVLYAVHEVTISATVSDPTATIVSGTGAHSLDAHGEHPLDVVVEAQDGSTEIYTITVTREAPSSNADLASLSLEEAGISPEFDPDTQSYTATVEYVIDSVTVAAAVAEDVATIQSGLGSHDLLVGSNDIDVVVQAEDMSTQEYTIEITREAAITRTFQARDVADETWYDVPATLLGSGDHALVFVEDESGVTIDTAAAVADEFDENIYDLIREYFAHEPDVDENGKVILLLLDIIDGYSGSGGYVAGYFDPTHLFETSTYANSNEADMIFVDVNPGEPASDAFYTTVAHEFQHLVNFAATYFDDETQQDTWINEGLSSASEYLYAGDHIESRIAYYNSDPLGTIGQGNNFYIWDGYWENFVGDQLANYSTVYLFFQWLRIHASNDALIYGEILSSSHRDYRTVLDAAQQRVDPSLSTWESVLGAWFQANLLSSFEGSGLQGYGGEIETAPWNFSATGGLEWYFSSGEGFVVQTEGDSFTYPGGSGSDIRYVGVDLTTHAIDATGPTYDGDCVIVFNSSTLIDLTDPSQVGVLPRVASPALSLLPSVQSNPAAMPESYPIDIQLQPGGGFAPDSHRPGERTAPFEPFERRGR